MEKRKKIYVFLEAFFIFTDILINIATGGSVGETISSRTGKQSLRGNKYALFFERFVNYLFIQSFIPSSWRGPNHCFNAIEWDVGISKESMAEFLYKKWIETKDLRYATSLRRIDITLHEMQY